jgi:hypothetical protein
MAPLWSSCAVVCSTVRRTWLMVGIGLLLGLVVGFLVGARVRIWPWRADWFEAAGTWFSAGLSAAILVFLAYRQEKVTRELEAVRQANERGLEALRISAGLIPFMLLISAVG